MGGSRRQKLHGVSGPRSQGPALCLLSGSPAQALPAFSAPDQLTFRSPSTNATDEGFPGSPLDAGKNLRPVWADAGHPAS